MSAEEIFIFGFYIVAAFILMGTGFSTLFSIITFREYFQKYKKEKGIVVDIDDVEIEESIQYKHIIEYSPKGYAIWAENSFSAAFKNPKIGEEVEVFYFKNNPHLVTLNIKERKFILLFSLFALIPVVLLSYESFRLHSFSGLITFLSLHFFGVFCFYKFFENRQYKKK